MRRHGRADALVASKAKVIVHLLDCSHESREKGQAADDPEKKSSDCSKRGSPVPP
jgi:hypothetical protein